MSELNHVTLPESLLGLCRLIASAGGHAWLVGGCVRDLILNTPANDYDLEVYGLQPNELKTTLDTLGRTEHVGRHFGVFKLWLDQLEIDVALPRSEAKSGTGHRGFDISIDPNLSPEKASLRRDFSINAMMFDPLDNHMMDFHGGIKDLKNSILRHVGYAFDEDPLRPLRAMQFAARFRLKLDHQTALLCQSMLPEAKTLSAERIWGEWRKWSHAPFPSYGLQALKDSGWLVLYPELKVLLGCPQSPRWHPEGDVWIHTLQVCDQAAQIANSKNLDDNTTEYLLFSSLCHDLGKPACTVSSGKSGEISSPGHSEAGIFPAERMMQQIAAPKRLIEFIRPLLLNHMTHLHGEPTPRAIRRLAYRLDPANIELWEMLVEADASGRAPAPPSRPAQSWLYESRRIKHDQKKPSPILTGKLLLQMGIMPGPTMGEILDRAYYAQLDGEFSDEQSAIHWCKQSVHPDIT